jgi:fibronectin type 3 domain-containing protein/TolB-like protein
LILLCAMGCATSNERYFLDVQSRANVYVAPVPVAIHKIAIMPFKAPTELIGSSVSDLFVTEMLRAGRYDLVERSQMTKVLSESELALAGLSAARAAQIGQMLGAEGVVIGTVDEYATVAHGGHPYPSVGISVRLIDCASGRVMWSADLAARADNKETTLPMEARQVAHELTAGLYQQWKVQPKVARSASATKAAAEPEPAALVGRNAPEAGASSGTATAPADLPAPAGAPTPATPPDFKVSDLGLREVQLTWGAPADATLQYRIERARVEDGPFDVLTTLPAKKQKYQDSGLQDSNAYFYRLVAVSATGSTSTPTQVRESMTAPPPEPPPAVRATAPASRAISLAWTPSPAEGVTSYVVERGSAEGGPYAKVGETERNELQEGGASKTDLRDSTTYFYRVTAINRVGAVGPVSKPVAVTTLPPPARVHGLLARSAEVRCVPLTWSMSPENDVIRYDVYRRNVTDTNFSLIASVKGREKTGYLDGGRDPGNLADNCAYEYCIRAINSVTAESLDCTPVKAVTRSVPPTVQAVEAKAGQPRQVQLKWAQSPDEKVVGYDLYRITADPAATNKIGEVSGRETVTFEDRGEKGWFSSGKIGNLKDGTEYQYLLVAFNTARAFAPASAAVAARTKLVPTQPTELVATTNLARSVKITFPSNPEKDIAIYVVEAASSADGKFKEIARVEAAEVEELWYTEENLSAGLQRFYRIKAIDKDTLESVWSAVVAGATKPLPAPPTSLQWKANTKELSWNASVTPDVKQYKVWKKGFVSSELLSTVSQTSCQFSAEQVGKKAKVMVSAVDADGLESLRSEVQEVVLDHTP